MEYRLSSRIKHIFLKYYMRIYGRFHKLEKKILFSSFGGKQYSDNPRAICEKMHDLYPSYELVWELSDKKDKYGLLPKYVRVVDVKSFAFFNEMSTAACIVTNEAIPPYFYKRKNQYIVQTWHGDRKFKKILFEVWDENGKERPIPLIDKEVVDLCVAGSDAGINLYHDAFHYYGEILCVGSPRNDRLLVPESDKKRLLKEKLNIDENTKILLYAPTFRDNQKGKQETKIDLDSVMGILSAKGNEWVCLLRAHTNSCGIKIDSQKYNKKFMDVTDYPDMADILGISDFLITDYSSSAGDFALTTKPIVLFIPDLEDYQLHSRALQVLPEEAGFIVANNNEELKSILIEKTEYDYAQSCKKANEFFGVKEEGDASEMVCSKINSHFIQNNKNINSNSRGFFRGGAKIKSNFTCPFIYREVYCFVS